MVKVAGQDLVLEVAAPTLAPKLDVMRNPSLPVATGKAAQPFLPSLQRTYS